MEKEYNYIPDDMDVSYDPDWDVSGMTNPDDFEGDYWETDEPDYLEDDGLDDSFFSDYIVGNVGNFSFIKKAKPDTDSPFFDQLFLDYDGPQKEQAKKLIRQKRLADIIKESGVEKKVKKIVSDSNRINADKKTLIRFLADTGEIDLMDDIEKNSVAPQDVKICLALKDLFKQEKINHEINQAIKSYSDILDLFSKQTDETTGEEYTMYDRLFEIPE